MPIAWSNGPVEFSNALRSDTGAHLIADLDTLLLAVHWTHQSTITGGFVYSIVSPQGLPAEVRIADAGGGLIHIQVTDVGNINPGAVHQFSYGAIVTGCQAVANQCQLFLSYPGVTNGLLNPPTSVALGIPRVPDSDGECTAGVTPPTVSTCWWSCGKINSFPSEAFDFRCSWWCVGDYSVSLNGATQVFSPYFPGTVPVFGPLCIFPLAPPNNIIDNGPAARRYSSDLPVSLDPLIGWLWQIRGQLWDAYQQSYLGTLDAITETTETDTGGGSAVATWITWNRFVSNTGSGTFYSTLYLLTEPPTTGGGGQPDTIGFAYAY